MLYHYTDSVSVKEIVSDGFLFPFTMPLYHNADSTSLIRHISPVVWLTRSVAPDGLVLRRMLACKFPTPLHHVFRVGVPDEYPCMTLVEYTAQHNYTMGDWKWLQLAGLVSDSFFTDWRLASQVIPQSEWSVFECMTQVDDNGNTTWQPVPVGGA